MLWEGPIKKGITAAAVLLLATVTVGVAPTGSAVEGCDTVGNHAESWVVVTVCRDIVESTQYVPEVELRPQTSEICPVVCVPVPANVHQWLVIYDTPVQVYDPSVAGTDIWVYPDRIEEALCTPYPPACSDGGGNDVIEELEEAIAIGGASSSGDGVDGVVLGLSNGGSVYIGFGALPP